MIRKNSNSSAGSSDLYSQGQGALRMSPGSAPKVELAIRQELFDHGVFPQMHGKITPAILIDTFTNLNLLSSIDYKIKLQSWIDQATKHI